MITTPGNATTRIDAVLTDLDGVLADSTAVVEASWRRWALQHDIDVAELFASMHGRPAVEIVTSFTPHLDPVAETRQLDKWESARRHEIELVPGALECVRFALERRWAVVTSGGRKLATDRMAAVGLPVPEILISADDVTRGKPDPQPYLLAARELGVDPERCVVIEDAPAGVTAGKAAGMTVFAVETTHRATQLAEADLALRSMHDVARELRRRSP